MNSKISLSGLENNLKIVQPNSLESFLLTHFVAQPKTQPQPKIVKPRTPRKDKTAVRVNYMADFETITVAPTRIWAWGLVDIDTPLYEKVESGTTIETFIERISRINSNCYFHNLKFDCRFFLDYLLLSDYLYIEDERRALEPGQFRALISDQMNVYSITVLWPSGYTTEFRDSYKRLPMSVARIAESFKLDVAKGEIDYHEDRPIGHILTDVELDYLKRDIVIPAVALNQTMKTGMKKLTIASDALTEYKELVGADNFKANFPILSQGLDHQIRMSYRGGFTYADPRFHKKIVGAGLVLDVNSLYPSVMRDALLPYGNPVYKRGVVETNDEYPFAIFEITFIAKLKPDHIPCIQIKGSNMWVDTEYLIDIDEPTTLMVTSVDWELYLEQYDIQILAYSGGWLFRARRGMFDAYIEKWAAIKESATGGLREIAKLYLNSLYGKFATNPNIRSRIPVLENGVVVMKRGVKETRDPVYTPVGSAITAYARAVTIRAAQSCYADFAYADTDSLHLLNPVLPKHLDIHKTRMGAWKHEYNFERAYYLRPKFYLEQKRVFNIHKKDCESDCEIKHNFETHIAGLPLKVANKLTFADIWDGNVLHGKMRPVAVPGGIVLEPVPFEIKIR